MTNTYRSRDQRVADQFQIDYMPCRICNTPTDRETLSEYGARCGTCYQFFLTGGKPNPPAPSRDQRIATLQRLKAFMAGTAPTGRAWAWKLKEREESGEELSFAQRHAWRSALHAHDTLDAVRGGADVPREAVDNALLETGDLPRLARAELPHATDPRFAAWVAAMPAPPEFDEHGGRV